MEVWRCKYNSEAAENYHSQDSVGKPRKRKGNRKDKYIFVHERAPEFSVIVQYAVLTGSGTLLRLPEWSVEFYCKYILSADYRDQFSWMKLQF